MEIRRFGQYPIGGQRPDAHRHPGPSRTPNSSRRRSRSTGARTKGLEAILRETPSSIHSYDKTMRAASTSATSSGGRATRLDECRVLSPDVRVAVPDPRAPRASPDPVEEWVYLGEIPILTGGGEFIVNGSERVIVSQAAPLARRRLLGRGRWPATRSCTAAGSSRSAARWIELAVSEEGRARDQDRPERHASPRRRSCARCREELLTNEALIRLFHNTKVVKIKQPDAGREGPARASTSSATSSTPAPARC